jgi:hypothetical protein
LEAVITADDLTVSAVCRDDGFITQLRQVALHLDPMNLRDAPSGRRTRGVLGQQR